ncbi:MAG: hypothetical protein H0U43_09600 [Chthoniobacterales bacterium]|nr:hypothetical protein [Chthoniobacterales bacterium]
MAIILVLAGLILSISGYVQKKGARSRAEAEIAAMSAAIESYKADNGIYPQSTATNALDPFTTAGPTATPHPNAYENASKSLYGSLSGDNVNYNNQLDGTETTNRTYLSFKSQMLGGTKNSSGNLTAVDMIRDPFGNSYGYSTMKASNSAASGSNPTFDLWSIADGNAGADSAKWVKNW